MADICVIGGGAAGMTAAVFAAEAGAKVTLLEGNRFCGKKLRITGKGRCNVTNNCDVRQFLTNVPVNGKFLYSALTAFPPRETMAWFEKLGVPLKTERGNRVFPVSDNAHDVAGALERAMRRAGVKVVNEKAAEPDIAAGALRGVRTESGVLPCAAAIVCTGGLSYPLTGSTGDGYAFARAAGHTVDECRPSLVPLESPDWYCHAMQGFAPRNVVLNVYDKRDKLVFSELGEMLFTHFGVSGPLVLSASAHMRADGEPYRLSIDFKPALDEKKLDERILRDLQKFKNRAIGNALEELTVKSMIPVLVSLSGIPPETHANAVTKQQRCALLELLKSFPVRISGTRPIAEAIVTSGGVAVGEINPRTMCSRLVKGLYFAGEVLDVDAFTGGFNLQIAWSTGRLAGISAAKEIVGT